MSEAENNRHDRLFELRVGWEIKDARVLISDKLFHYYSSP